MKFKLISFAFLLSFSSLSLAVPLFKITPESAIVAANQGDPAFISYIIENNTGIAIAIKIFPPITPQPTKIFTTTCPVGDSVLAVGASCAVTLTTNYAAQSGLLGKLEICDAKGFLCSVNTSSVRINVN